jgi:hypothetical protein
VVLLLAGSGLVVEKTGRTALEKSREKRLGRAGNVAPARVGGRGGREQSPATNLLLLRLRLLGRRRER